MSDQQLQPDVAGTSLRRSGIKDHDDSIRARDVEIGRSNPPAMPTHQRVGGVLGP